MFNELQIANCFDFHVTIGKAASGIGLELQTFKRMGKDFFSVLAAYLAHKYNVDTADNRDSR